MPERSTGEVTELLAAWCRGNKHALEQLVPLIYGELHRLAARSMRNEESGHTLQSTALVNEVYLRMVDSSGSPRMQWQNRVHFFAVASSIIRNILVDHARARRTGKRGSGARAITIDDAIASPQTSNLDLEALDDALERLANLDAQQARIVELRFFGGLSIEETAEVLNISRSTVKRHWIMARTWIYRDLSKR
jgi:RNA polymerase sigma factor (TIGR02999 family)